MKATTLLLIDDDTVFRQVLANELEQRGYEVARAGSGGEGLRVAEERDPQVVLLDLQLPDVDGLQVLQRLRAAGVGAEVILLTGHGSIDTAIEAIRLGAFDYVAKPCPLDELEVRIQRALERRSLRKRADLLERGLTPADPGASFLGESPSFRRVKELIERVAPSDSSVLILGETGTGKEMAAKMLHARSARRDRPFVVVECAALQEDLLQSELFGHERGAFTGADRTKPGLFEVAHGGTIFLDEIGEVSEATQVKLLRVLDTSTFRRVGGTDEVRVDVRVLAATNRDLASMVQQGRFRHDLYYRLKTITIELPPLRDRPGDVALLARHFAERRAGRYGVTKRLGAAALERLCRHRWPGNVRELLHAVEAAMVVCAGPEVLVEHLPPGLHAERAASETPGPDAAEEEAPPTLAEIERRHIARVLRVTNGHRGNAARILGISERNLYRKIREHDLSS